MKSKDIFITKIPDVRPLDQRTSKRIKPGQKSDAREQLFFSDESQVKTLPDLDTDLASLLPDYVRKRKKYGYEVL